MIEWFDEVPSKVCLTIGVMEALVSGYLWWLWRTVFLHGSGCMGVFFCRVALAVSTLTKLGKPSLTQCKARIARM